ncbi:hemolysin III family protein, partial [Mycobacterium tuberculosis]|uniref:hemolysin III family protein n=1 Tax=Mycobacterium tuberculosis TaxID=1773 RepID=UPI001EEE9599
VLLFVGGALYSIGGILYAVRWPDPWPTTFGYHEFFHACTAVAHFGDPQRPGRWFDTADDAERLMLRPSDPLDGATPSGAS